MASWWPATIALALCLQPDASGADSPAPPPQEPYVVVLGVTQDAGHPQAGTKPGEAWQQGQRRHAACLGIVDPTSGGRWLIDATPDFREQLHRLDLLAPRAHSPELAGILLTHAHIGHYTGLIHLGHEALGAREVAVYAMPRMRGFLEANGPWDQLVRYRNVVLRALEDGVAIALGTGLSVTPLRVPHRDEYSETVGFRVDGAGASVLYVPDIDKWSVWDAQGTRVETLISGVDVAYLDATFFSDGELPGRNMAEIPHPFVVESMQRFAALPREERGKIRFIHLNHTNPALFAGSPQRAAIEAAGFAVAEEGEIVALGARP